MAKPQKRHSTAPVNDGSIESASAIGDWMRKTVDNMPPPWRALADDMIWWRLEQASARLAPARATVEEPATATLPPGFPELPGGGF